jgi:hypothetical protein
MVPYRRLSEVLTSARLNSSFANILVEGPTDKVILGSFCEGEKISTVIYPVCFLEVDCVNPAGLGGNKGRLVRISEYLSSNGARRIFCVVDKDDMTVAGFDLNSHCLITDLANMQIYALDIKEFREYVSRFFASQVSKEQFVSVVDAARAASCLHWRKERLLSGFGLANIERSLRFTTSSMIELDLTDWIDRSRVKGGEAEAWDALCAEVEEIKAQQLDDPRKIISIEFLNDVVRFWVREAFGKAADANWVVRHLRGAASHERLSTFPFFQTVADRCRQELGSA